MKMNINLQKDLKISGKNKLNQIKFIKKSAKMKLLDIVP
jgi:hypothetical protein